MKKLLALTMSLIMATGLIGCGNKTNTNTNPEVETEATDTSELEESILVDNDTQVLVEHSKGIAIVPKNPKKIAVFDFGILDSLNTLGIDVEVAVPVDNLPSYLSNYEETATNAGGIKEPDIEALFNFEPEIIFISGRQSDYYDELSEIAPTVYVELNSDTYMDDVYYNTVILHEIFEVESAEEELLKLFIKLDEVQQKASASEEKALILLVNDGSISTYGRGSRFGMVFDVLNVTPADENIEVSTHGQEVSYEYISEINPDIIFVINRNEIVGGEAEGIEALNNDLVNGTNAAKAGKIINLDSEIWYLAGGGLSSVYKMLEEIEVAFN